MNSLSEESCEYLKVPYYWGKYRSKHIKSLKQQPSGSYFTALKDSKANSFVVCFVNMSGKVESLPCESPIIPKSNKEILSLKHPLRRPSTVSILDLAPMLKKPVRTLKDVQT